MKKLLFLLLFIANYGYNQTKILGKVVDNDTHNPLEGANVFVSNTTLQTITSADGTFEISVPESHYQLIVSYIGYQSIVTQSENFNDLSKRQIIYLLPLSEILKTVKIISKKDREKYLNIFTKNLIGTSENAQKTKILNLDDINLNINETNGDLEVSCETPLIIENPELKYRLTYLLSDFKYDFNNQLCYSSGYTSFEDLNTDERKKAKINKRRKKTYKGSIMHFIRSLYNNSFTEEGYIINNFSRNLNPKYPGDLVMKSIYEEARKTNDYSKLRNNIQQKYIISFKKFKLKQNDLLKIDDDNNMYLSFNDDYLEIKYYNESEETNYLMQYQKLNDNTQTSQLKIESEKIIIYPNGNFSNPEGIIFYGYMGWKKLADTLPLDYNPE